MPDTNRRVQTIIDEFMGGLAATGRTARTASTDGRGAKRSAEDLAQLEEQVLSFVAKHPGLRIEQINEQLGTSTKDLALPIRKLIATKKLKTVGQRRSTKYFAGGSAAKARATGGKGGKRRAHKTKSDRQSVKR